MNKPADEVTEETSPVFDDLNERLIAQFNPNHGFHGRFSSGGGSGSGGGGAPRPGKVGGMSNAGKAALHRGEMGKVNPEGEARLTGHNAFNSPMAKTASESKGHVLIRDHAGNSLEKGRVDNKEEIKSSISKHDAQEKGGLSARMHEARAGEHLDGAKAGSAAAHEHASQAEAAARAGEHEKAAGLLGTAKQHATDAINHAKQAGKEAAAHAKIAADEAKTRVAGMAHEAASHAQAAASRVHEAGQNLRQHTGKLAKDIQASPHARRAYNAALEGGAIGHDAAALGHRAAIGTDGVLNGVHHMMEANRHDRAAKELRGMKVPVNVQGHAGNGVGAKKYGVGH